MDLLYAAFIDFNKNITSLLLDILICIFNYAWVRKWLLRRTSGLSPQWYINFLIIKFNYKFELLISRLGKLISPLPVAIQTYHNKKIEAGNGDVSHQIITSLSLMDLKWRWWKHQL